MAACETTCCNGQSVHGAAPIVGDKWYARDRLGGLRRFALAITIFNVLGHFWFGFEQSWAQPLVGLAGAYGMELLVELVDVLMTRRRPRFLAGGLQNFIDFFLPAHISGLACGMLLYANERLMPIAFAAAVAIASKAIFRVMTERGPRHVFNPSNFGITVTLLLFPWVGIAPPYHFTENLSGWGDWIVPCVIIVSGSLLNTCFTRRLPLILTWVSVFVLQAFTRHLLFDASLSAALMPMTGVAFILFTFYMVTDPPTTPSSTPSQIAFAASVAITYGVLMALHVVFTLFFALSIVCAVRGLYMWVKGRNVTAATMQSSTRPATGAAVRPMPFSPTLAREPVEPSEPVASAGARQ
jgi:hypothetical protein